MAEEKYGSMIRLPLDVAAEVEQFGRDNGIPTFQGRAYALIVRGLAAYRQDAADLAEYRGMPTNTGAKRYVA